MEARRAARTLMVAFLLSMPALSVGLPGAAAAHTFALKELDDLVAEADQIVIAVAVGKRGRALPSGVIVTDVSLSPVAALKGGPVADPLVLQVLGGTVGDVRLEAVGFPEFILGIKYLVFVKDNGTTILPMVGGDQGLFQIRFNPRRGLEEMADSRGRPIRASAMPRAVTTESAAGEALAADVFVRAIRERLGR